LPLHLRVHTSRNGSPGDWHDGEDSRLPTDQAERVSRSDRRDPEVGLDIVDVQCGIEQNAPFRLAEATEDECGANR
jgi:hypothetical protein